MRLDAHQHFWHYDAREYPWIGDDVLRRDFLPSDLERELAANGFSGSIAVQARQTVAESRWLLELAAESETIKGVVGWVELAAADVAETLADLARYPKFVGVRHVVQDEPDEWFMLRPDFLRGLAWLAEFDLTYDLLVFSHQLRAAAEVAARFPRQRFVLDHVAKPAIKDGIISPWREDLLELARHPNVACKLSGMVTEARRSGWRKSDFRAYLDAAWAAFGEDRLMFGSDWPVCLLAADYGRVTDLVEDYLAQFSEATRAKVLGDNAAQFYRLPELT